jgi:hypothetical protein
MHHVVMPHTLGAYILLAVDIVILVWVLFLAAKYTFRPGEESADHIKRRILEDGPGKQEKPGDAPPPAAPQVVTANPWSRSYPPRKR